MATGPGFPSSTNVYIPTGITGANGDATARMIVGFSRSPAKFRLPLYCKYQQMARSQGYYLKLSTHAAVRVVNTYDYGWVDGAKKSNPSGVESFNNVPVSSERYNYDFRLGMRTTMQADWPIVEAHAAIKAQLCMTNRTTRMITAATTAASWQTTADPDLSVDHTGTGTSLGGGKWDAGSSTAPYFKTALGKIASIINIDSNGVISSAIDRFMIVINPTTARLIASSAEVHDYIARSPFAQAELMNGAHPNGEYGLPSMMYGYQIVVENAVRETNREGDTVVKTTVMADNVALVLTRPGGLVGQGEGVPDFSTLTYFWFNDEMTIESREDPWNRLIEGSVVEDGTEVVTCPATGYYATAVTG